MENGFQRSSSSSASGNHAFVLENLDTDFDNNNFSSRQDDVRHNRVVSGRARSHTRSSSWSHTLIQSHSSQAMASSIFSPIRGAIQGIVPTLTETVTAAAAASSSSSNRGLSSPGFLPLNSNGNHDSHSSRHNSTSSARHNIAGHVRSRSDASSRHHSRQSSTVEINMDSDNEQTPPSPGTQENNGTQRNDSMEFLGTITWVERALPFVLLLLSRIMWDHRLGILVFIGLFGTFFHVNSTIRKQVALKDRRLHRISAGVFLFIFANIFAIYYVFNSQYLQHCLIFSKPNFHKMDIWIVFWCVGITDFVVRFVTMATKCFMVVMPTRLINFRKRGKYFLMIENLSQFYRMTLPVPIWYHYFTKYDIGGEYFALLSTTVYIVLKARMLFLKFKEIVSAFNNMCKDTRYGRTPSKEVLMELGDSCPICQEEMTEPIELSLCKHIFCEDCIGMWFDRERTCPMCRAKVAEDPQWRDGNTQSFIQFF